MNQKLIPEIGKQYGQWIVISEEIKKGVNRQTYWKVKCKCGLETFRSASSLVSGNTKSCKSCSQTDVYNTFALSYFRRIENRAKSLNLEFDLDIEFLWNLYEKQNKKCAISNIPIEFKNGWRTNNPQTASLDRIENSKGYTKDNVQWLHKTVNMMKHTKNQKEFINVCKQIAQNN